MSCLSSGLGCKGWFRTSARQSFARLKVKRNSWTKSPRYLRSWRMLATPRLGVLPGSLGAYENLISWGRKRRLCHTLPKLSAQNAIPHLMGRNSTKCWPVTFSLFFWDNSGLDLQTFFRTRVVPGRVLGKASQLPGGQEAGRPGHAVAKCCAGYRGCNALFHGVVQQGRAVSFKLRRCNSWILTPFTFTRKNRWSMICFHTALISIWKLSVDNMVLLLSISWSLVKLQVLRALDLRLLACHHILLEDFPKNLLEVRGHGVQLRGREDLARPKLEAKIRHQETTLCKASPSDFSFTLYSSTREGYQLKKSTEANKNIQIQNSKPLKSHSGMTCRSCWRMSPMTWTSFEESSMELATPCPSWRVKCRCCAGTTGTWSGHVWSHIPPGLKAF